MDARHHTGTDRQIGRRWFLLGGSVLVLAGAGAGVATRLGRDGDADTAVPHPPPAQLVAAAARERGLIADLDATTGAAASVRALLARTRADHAAHLAALESLLAGFTPPQTSPAPGRTVTVGGSDAAVISGSPRSRAQLRAAETRASVAAASAALLLDGRAATLLASISASEAGHAVVLA